MSDKPCNFGPTSFASFRKKGQGATNSSVGSLQDIVLGKLQGNTIKNATGEIDKINIESE